MYFQWSFESNALSVEEQDIKIIFNMAAAAVILDFRMEWLCYFCSTSGHDIYYQVSSQLAFWVKEKNFKIDFQDSSCGFSPEYPIVTILAIFDLQVTLMLPTKFPVNWSFGSGEKVQNRFSKWRLWQSSWISDRNNLSYFWSTSPTDTCYQVWSQLAFWFRRKGSK